MPKGKYISVGQIPKLQALYSQFAAAAFNPATLAYSSAATERTLRLEWASKQLGREIESFKQLTRSEASKLIDILLRALGQEVVAPDRSKRSRAGGRNDAQRRGTAGRKNDNSSEVRMVTADDLSAIDALLDELAWDRARLDAFLRSPSSPLGRRSDPQVRTDKDANRVIWALKRIRARQEKKVSA
jgi:hypothetical protein